MPNNVAIPHEMEFRVKPEFLRVLHTLEDIDRNKEVFTYLDVSTDRVIFHLYMSLVLIGNIVQLWFILN